MDVSKISGAAAFAPRRSALAAPEQRESPLQQVLQRMDEQRRHDAGYQKLVKDREHRRDVFLSSTEGALGMRWKDMSDRDLKDFQHLALNHVRASQVHEDALNGFKDQLSVFDAAVREAQGDEARLGEVRAAREQFLQDSASLLDTSAEDLYAEADKALSAAKQRTAHVAEGLANISRELVRRGYEAYSYGLDPETAREHFAPQLGKQPDPVTVAAAYLQRILEKGEN